MKGGARFLAVATIVLTALAGPLSDGISDAAVSASADPRVGLYIPLSSSQGEILRQIESAMENGIGWVRLPLDWNRVQPVRGAFDWSAYDELAAAARARQMEVVFVLGPTAQWASRAPLSEPEKDRIWKMPRDWADWQEYVRAAVSHFRGRVRFWQIWEGFDFSHFRAPASQIAVLARLTHEAAKAADPDCSLLLPETGGIDLGWIDWLRTTETWKYFDVLALRPFEQEEPDSLLIPLAALQSEILTKGYAKKVWIVGRARGLSPGAGNGSEERVARFYSVAFACGVDRVFWPLLPSPGRLEKQQIAQSVSYREAALRMLEPVGEMRKAVFGMNLSPRESGLYNARFRNWPGGRLVERAIGERRALGTRMQASLLTPEEREKDNPWFYFDVDDRFLFFTKGRVPIAITVECLGANAPKQAGFNIYYDAGARHRFSRWQWIEPGEHQWFTYRIVLSDACFANKDGYDFRINAKGSKEDVYISRVEVEPLFPDGKG